MKAILNRQLKKTVLLCLAGIAPVMLKAQTNYTASWTATLLSTGNPGSQGVSYVLKGTAPNGALLTTGPFLVTFPAGTDATSIIDPGEINTGFANCGVYDNGVATRKATVTGSTATSVNFTTSVTTPAGNDFVIILGNITNPAAGTYTNLIMTVPNSTGGVTTFNNSNYTVAPVANLVPNPSFEINGLPPSGVSTGHAMANYCGGTGFGGYCGLHAGCVGWHGPSNGTSDYFNANAINVGLGVPVNFASQSPGQNAKTGNAYAGIILNSPGWREYIQARLTTPLVSGTTYAVSMYVNLGKQNTKATDRLGIYLSTTPLTTSGSYTLGVTPQITNPAGNYLTDQINWMLISGTFISSGGEEYITIGNFYDDAGTTTTSVAGNGIPISDNCYYYIEDVCVATLASGACGVPLPALTLTTSFTGPACSGQCTGTATANPSGGTSPYTYTWAGGQTAQTATGLCAGTYSVTVTDAVGVTGMTAIAVTQPAALSTSVTSTASACGNNNGTAAVAAAGGSGNYTYLWNPSGQTTQTATGLAAGTYTALVTDANGCPASNTVTVTTVNSLSVSVTSTQAGCTLNNGTATAISNNGTPPYTYNWNNSQTTQTATGLAAGNYSVIVTDVNGCSAAQTVSVTSISNTLSVSVISTQAGCTVSNGTATANPGSGTPPYTYSWNNSQTTQTATGLAVGNYSVMVTDVNGCSATQTVSVAQSSAITASVTSTATACGSNTGTAAANASGGTGTYTYNWNPSGQTSQTATGLGAGNYSVTITDVNGCSSSFTIAVTNSNGPTAVAGTSATITLGNTANLTASGGITYSWSPSTGLSCTTCANPTVTPLWGAGGLTYCVFVTDAGGCSDSACVTIYVELPCGDIFVPNVFSANNDGANELECVLGGCIKELQFIIYNRWGEKVFETTGSPLPSGGPGWACWDGTYKGKLMNTAVFVYYLDVTLTNGEKISKKGNISLIR
ncbi:MAG: hypothetical protein EPN85_07365 [Bacteroidetes bacterium]|nr:MAG: hypothetical protein EPN85_07365 [Bacteroidota bacterium]